MEKIYIQFFSFNLIYENNDGINHSHGAIPKIEAQPMPKTKGYLHTIEYFTKFFTISYQCIRVVSWTMLGEQG